MYVEFTRSEKFEEFIRCHENAYRYFSGVPREIWYDNLATAVSDRMGSLVRFNARFLAYSAHHLARPHACNVASGNEKGRVEDLIKYIRMNFWSGRVFNDFADMQSQLSSWRDEIANLREHRSHRRIVRLVFEGEEKAQLQTPNPVPYDTDEIFSRSVTSDFHLQYETNRYSVPWTLVGMTVTVRVSDREIKVFYHEKFVCSHQRSYLKNKVFSNEEHRKGLLARKPGAMASSAREGWQLEYVRSLGPKMTEYVDLIRRGPRSLKYELSRLIGLLTIYGEGVVLHAVKECLFSGVVGVDNLEIFLKRMHHPSSINLNPAPIKFESEKLNRAHAVVDLRKYDALYFGMDDKQRTGASEEEEGDDGATDGDVRGAKAQVLGASDGEGHGRDAGPREGLDHEIPKPMDLDREGGAEDGDDPKPHPHGKV